MIIGPKIFDLDEAPARKAKNIKVLFSGVSNKDKLHKVIVVFQAEGGVIGKNIEENFDNTKKKWRRYKYCCSK